jgi:hypothetical protein
MVDEDDQGNGVRQGAEHCVHSAATSITMFRRGTHHPRYLTESLYVIATLRYVPILRNV